MPTCVNTPLTMMLTIANVPIETCLDVPKIGYNRTGNNDTYSPTTGGKEASWAYANPKNNCIMNLKSPGSRSAIESFTLPCGI